MQPDTQGDVFRTSEADNWFRRNRSAIGQPATQKDGPLSIIEQYGIRPKRVLEIGCANGHRLAAVEARYGSAVLGVEPSLEAINDGRQRFPRVDLRQGMAEALPVEEKFDLVILNFVLHWVDRRNLFRCAAEIDRVLEDGGFLVIGDFFPTNPTRTLYHHLPGAHVYTYKQDYASLFLASSLYQRIGLITGGHGAKVPQIEEAEANRIGTWLLRKHVGSPSAELPPPL